MTDTTKENALTKGFTVTYEIVTPESALQGDVESRGYVDSHCFAVNRNTVGN